MKTKKIFIIITAFLLTGCSPIDKVKWSQIDLLGNNIRVYKIVNRISGDNNKVTWTLHPQKIMQESDIVSVNINRKGAFYFMMFSYDRNNGECRLLEYRIDGKPESPLYIYKFLTVNRNNYIPEFIGQYL